MPYDSSDSGPSWLEALNVQGYTYNSPANGSSSTQWAPYMGDPKVMSLYQNLVQALGARFDGLPGFGPIDIGSIGLWGEWHNWGSNVLSVLNGAPAADTSTSGTGNQIPMPPLSVCEQYVNWFFTYFPNTINLREAD